MKRYSVLTLVVGLIFTSYGQTKMYINKTNGTTDSVLLSQVRNIAFTPSTGTNYFFNQTLWEGQWWSGNVLQGNWFPTIDSVAHFGIDNFSWGIVRTRATIPLATSFEYSVRLVLNSGGTNGVGALFGFGDRWGFYDSGHFIGVIFSEDRTIKFYKDGTPQNQIGTYSSGQSLVFRITLNSNGTVTYSSGSTSATSSVSSSVSTHQAIVMNMNNLTNGFTVRSVVRY